MFYDLCGIFLCIHDLHNNLMIEILTQVCVNLMILTIWWWTQVFQDCLYKVQRAMSYPHCQHLCQGGCKHQHWLPVLRRASPYTNCLCCVPYWFSKLPTSLSTNCLCCCYHWHWLPMVPASWHVLLIVYFCSSFLSCQLTCMD